MERNGLIPVLLQAACTKQVLSFQINAWRVSGYVLGVEKTRFLLVQLLPNGENGGLFLRDVAQICSIDYGGEYEKMLTQISSTVDVKGLRARFSNELLEPLLQYVYSQKRIVTICEKSNTQQSLQGYVNQWNHTHLTLSVIDNGGLKKGWHIVETSQLISIAYSTLETKASEQMVAYRYNPEEPFEFNLDQFRTSGKN